jgi:hypothetical protein
MFPVITVPDDAADLIEQLGTKPKFWYKHDNADYLFKEVRNNTGEDWAEKVSSELFALIGIPYVKYDLAIWKDKKGVICPSFVPSRGRLVHGNELFAKVVPGYPATKFYHIKQYTLRRVLAIIGLRDLFQLPIGWESLDVRTPIGVFVGYLMMDAWIANQDRHHQNWGFVLRPESVTIHLAPSYDHASSLGSHENDDNRSERLTTHDRRRSMEQYVNKAASAFFASTSAEKPLLTIEAFIDAGKLQPEAADAWLSRLDQVSSSDTRSILEQVPLDRISTVGIDFAHKILELNRGRLLALKRRLR